MASRCIRGRIAGHGLRQQHHEHSARPGGRDDESDGRDKGLDDQFDDRDKGPDDLGDQSDDRD